MKQNIRLTYGETISVGRGGTGGPLVLPDWWAADYSFRLISRQQAELPSHMATPSADTLLAPHCGLITNLMGLNLVS